MVPLTSEEKLYGRTYTPGTVSAFLSNWAIQSKDDIVLEPCVGDGRFVLNAYDRLRRLGAAKEEARRQIIGVDTDEEAVEALQKRAEGKFGSNFPKIKVGDFFSKEFPEVDAVIGNPPYVIRHRFESSEEIVDKYASKYGFSNQADLYCYFTVEAAEVLRPSGRLAMIVSNSWMKRKYGEEFKKFLLGKFDLRALIGFKEQVFPDRLVNSVCILGERNPSTTLIPDDTTVFAQVENPKILKSADILSSKDTLQAKAIHTAFPRQSSLDPEDYWDIWLRAPSVFDSIKGEKKIAPLKEMATPMIGVQTLAKEFYILSKEDAEQKGIEQMFLRRFAYSPRNHQKPILYVHDCKHYLFWCSKRKDELKGTNALKHIEEAEQRTVEKRYSGGTYDGLHNKPRIKKANRSPWYDLTKEAKRRLPAQILLPRRVYKNYMVIWNKEGVIPNENFLAVRVDSEAHVKPLLAYLNSRLGELCLRLSGQVYGGGVCDLNVSSARNIQTIDLNKLTKDELALSEESFDKFKEVKKRKILDNAIYEILEFNKQQRREIGEALGSAIEESLSK